MLEFEHLKIRDYYTDVELARLWPELELRPVYAALCKLAVTTGARFGELAALRWTDCNLLDREIRIARTYTVGIGEQTPKSGESRTLDLTSQAAGVLEEWYKQAGGEGLVFEREEGGHLSDRYARDVLYAALERAGIPRAGEHDRNRDFHSLRHTFARVALEHAAPIDWVRRQLGHSSITLTVDTYGEWSRDAQKAEASRLDGAFTL